jgi:hypothetical protein
MWNGNLGNTRAILLAVAVVSLGGCDAASAPAQPPQAAGAAAERQPPSLRYQVDPARNRVWFLTREGVFLHDVTTPDRTVVSLPDWLWADAPYGCLPDLALGPRGEAVITSNIIPTLWRIDPETLAVSAHRLELDADTDKDVGFSGLAYSAEHGAFFAVSDLHGSLWRIDRTLARAEKVSLSEPLPRACGLAVGPRIAQQRANRMDRLCVGASQESRTIDLAPDQRSAYVRAGPCARR